ncbi:MAG TPA: sensor domain-containing diguanylate cyclase [Solirubrobacteraceae bacterium]
MLAVALDELAVAESVEDVQRLVSSAARQLSGADGATVVLRDGHEWSYVEEDAIQPLWKGRRFAVADSLTGWSMLDGQPIIIEDVYADRRLPHDRYRRTFVKSLLVVSIRASAPIGAIGMYWAERHRATTAEVAVVRALAASVAVVLERVYLRHEVERRRATEQDLRELSERDPLTGLLNRRAWDQLLASALRPSARPLYVAVIDLDDFKGYNDLYGHPAGDRLLRRAARKWRTVVRSGDALARYGGEEFAVLLAGCEPDTAIQIAERLRVAAVDEREVSIGIACWDGAESADRLVDRADRALYDAKRTGRNRVTVAATPTS